MNRTIWTKCVCGHYLYDHYSKRYNERCIHGGGGVYTGMKCLCPGFTTDNLIYLERLCQD